MHIKLCTLGVYRNFTHGRPNAFRSLYKQSNFGPSNGTRLLGTKKKRAMKPRKDGRTRACTAGLLPTHFFPTVPETGARIGRPVLIPLPKSPATIDTEENK